MKLLLALEMVLIVVASLALVITLVVALLRRFRGRSARMWMMGSAVAFAGGVVGVVLVATTGFSSPNIISWT